MGMNLFKCDGTDGIMLQHPVTGVYEKVFYPVDECRKINDCSDEEFDGLLAAMISKAKEDFITNAGG